MYGRSLWRMTRWKVEICVRDDGEELKETVDRKGFMDLDYLIDQILLQDLVRPSVLALFFVAIKRGE
jgi:hypothetical protein